MLGLPKSTEVKRPLPKLGLYKRLDWTPSQRENFDAEVSRLDFVNWISPQTLPAIAIGNNVKEIFIVEVSLKTRNFDPKTIALLAKQIPQRIVYLLHYEEEIRLAVYHTKLFITDWQFLSINSPFLILQGLNLDAVWENIVRYIGNINSSSPSPIPNYSFLSPNSSFSNLSEQIKAEEERTKLERQIAALEHKMNATKQPRRKRELFLELQKLKNKL